jgi:hypothetical protein
LLKHFLKRLSYAGESCQNIEGENKARNNEGENRKKRISAGEIRKPGRNSRFICQR